MMELPAELTDLFPGREVQIRALWRVLGAESAASGCVVCLYGPPGAGKRQMVTSALQYCRADWAITSCAECADASSAARSLTRQILGGARLPAGAGLSVLSTLLEANSRLIQSHVVLILEDVDHWLQHDQHDALLSLLKVASACGRRVTTVVCISTSPIQLIHAHIPNCSRVVEISADAYVGAALAQLTSRVIDPSSHEGLQQSFTEKIAMDSLWMQIARRSLCEMAQYMALAWRLYSAPIAQGECDASEAGKLHKMFQSHQAMLAQSRASKDIGGSPEIPRVALVLLVASFLACSVTLKQKPSASHRKHHWGAKAGQVRMRAVPLADLMAMFALLVKGLELPGLETLDCTQVPVLEQLSALIDLGLVVQVRKRQYLCAVSKRTIEAIAPSLDGFKLERWHL